MSVTAQTQADLENVLYTELYNVALNGADTLFFCPILPVSGTTALTFGGIAYTSFPLARSPIRSSSDGEVDGLSVEFQNVDQVFGAVLENNVDALSGATVTISGVFLASGTNAPVTQTQADLIPVFDGNIGTIEVNDEKVKVQVNFPIKDIRAIVPRRTYSQADGFTFVPLLPIR